METDLQSTLQRSPVLCACGACHLWDSRAFNSYRSACRGDLLLRWGMCACVLQYIPRALAGDPGHSRCSLKGFLMKK